MSRSPNDITIDAYNQNINKYIEQTPLIHNGSHVALLRWLDDALVHLPQPHNILEIGSGTGREAHYIQAKGFNILCSDAAQAFVNYLRINGQQAVLLNILKDNLEDTYAMILMNAVAPHLTREDLRLVLEKVHKALVPGGLFVISAKQGYGEKWTTEKLKAKRFIHYWQPKELVELVNYLGYETTFLESDIPGDLHTHIWIHMTAKKV